MRNYSMTSLKRLTIDTNPDQCNLNCIMCEDHSPYSDSKNIRKEKGLLRKNMDPELIPILIKEASELGVSEVIPSTMGEPLLYAYFDLIVEECKKNKILLNLTTNGTFPKTKKYKSVTDWAELIIPNSSDVKISWNGASTEIQNKIMFNSNLENHIKNAEEFIRVRDSVFKNTGHRCSVTMQLTFLKSNLEEIPEMVRLAQKLGFDRIKGHQLWTHFEEIQGEAITSDFELRNRWNEVVLTCEEIAQKENSKTIKLDNFNPLKVSTEKKVFPDGDCPFLGKELWVNPQGILNVCCAPDQQRKSLGDFGVFPQTSLKQLLNGKEYRNLIRNYKSYSLCNQCNMRKIKGLFI